jgi:hypothetical protein
LAERRKHRRISCDLSVRWQRVQEDADSGGHLFASGPVETADARDFSRGGLAFHVRAPLEVGATLQLSFERGGGPPLSALGRVARCDRDGDAWVAGVELTWIECAAPEQALGLSPANAWTLL